MKKTSATKNASSHAKMELDKIHMRELARAGCPAPCVIGIDEVSIRKGWFGGDGRREVDRTSSMCIWARNTQREFVLP